MEQSKTCARCKRQLSVDRFPRGKIWSDGLFPYCRECKREAVRISAQKHRAKYREQARLRYKTDEIRREAVKARARARYYADPEAAKVKIRAWQLANIDRVRQIKLESSRRIYATNPEPQREAWRRRHAHKKAVSVVPFTIEELKLKVAYWGYRCWICGDPYQAIDHVKPLNKGGLHILANLRPICTPCNTRKRDRWPYNV